ncbi:site-specific DNA-methyltransferase [Methylobacterium sp. CCH5-D2]|uniref:DNA-methyltransferase n=1 Tax=Methylobacterium sp. CCH5-D2 TaxID=1768765 RepID=UPI00082EC1D1|nr:site-specific DNA-methyltransferase [Methylobacterium sp. CCH5-D2]
MPDPTLILGDCLSVIPTLPAGSVDAIIADLPYGSTRCAWDQIIPFDALWAAYRHVLAPNGVVVLTASGVFSALLTVSNLDWFRYRWTWDKVNRMSGHLNAKRQPLRVTEDVLVFAPGPHTYNPQMVQGEPYRKATKADGNVYKFQRPATTDCSDGLRYPRDLITIKADRRGAEGRLLSSQKPEELMRYLVATYTRPGDLVLDSCAGTGTTGIACRALGRRSILIEKAPAHHAIAARRLAQAEPEPLLALAA